VAKQELNLIEFTSYLAAQSRTCPVPDLPT